MESKKFSHVDLIYICAWGIHEGIKRRFKKIICFHTWIADIREKFCNLKSQ